MALTIKSQVGQLTNANYSSNHVTQWGTTIIIILLSSFIGLLNISLHL